MLWYNNNTRVQVYIIKRILHLLREEKCLLQCTIIKETIIHDLRKKKKKLKNYALMRVPFVLKFNENPVGIQ